MFMKDYFVNGCIIFFFIFKECLCHSFSLIIKNTDNRKPKIINFTKKVEIEINYAFYQKVKRKNFLACHPY